MARLLAAKDRAPTEPEESPVLEGRFDDLPVTALKAEERPLERGIGQDPGVSEAEEPAAGVAAGREAPDQEEMTSRLLAAKRRARRQSDE
jgi:hypothetical protein